MNEKKVSVEKKHITNFASLAISSYTPYYILILLFGPQSCKCIFYLETPEQRISVRGIFGIFVEIGIQINRSDIIDVKKWNYMYTRIFFVMLYYVLLYMI